MLPPGATLLLYTDGLVDRRPTRESGVPSRDLSEAVRSAVRRDLQDRRRAGRAHRRRRDHRRARGDRRRHGDPGRPVGRWRAGVRGVRLPGPADHGRRGRGRMARSAFERWNIPEEKGELACLLVSEVVTNVVLHAASTSAPRRELVLDGPPLLRFDESWDFPDLEVDLDLDLGREGIAALNAAADPREEVHAPAAPGRRVDLGRGVRPGPAAAPHPQRRGERRRRARALPGRPAGPALGFPADLPTGRPSGSRSRWAAAELAFKRLRCLTRSHGAGAPPLRIRPRRSC